MKNWTYNLEFIRLMKTCRVNNEDRIKLEDTYFLTFARMGKLRPDSPFPYCDDFNYPELAMLISTLIEAFKKPDYKKWEKIRAWRLHHAIAFLYEIDPDSFFPTLDYYYTLRDMGRLDTAKYRAFVFSQLLRVSFPIEQVFILAQDEYKAGFFRTIGKWENNEEVLVDPFTFLQWAETHGHQIPEELRGIQPPVETHAEPVTTGGDDPAPAPAAIVPVPEGTTWEQVSIHIGNDQHIMIRHPGGSARWTREDLRLENKPKIWTLFQACAIGEGHIPMKSEQMHSERQNLSNLKKHMKLIFGIEDDPINRWSLEDGYVCKFGITMNPEHLNMRDHYANDDPLEDDIKEAMLNQRN